MSTVVKDLGAVSAYAYAVEKGYTGTEAEFAELMASYAEVGQTATTAAQTATTKAGEAQTSAQTASSKASEATTAAATATTAKDDAVSAKTAAETAQGKAEDAQAAAESVAESIPSDYSQLSEDVSDLKEGLTNKINASDILVLSSSVPQATLTNYKNALNIYSSTVAFSSSGLEKTSFNNGVMLFTATSANQKNPNFRTNSYTLGSGKWLVGFKFKVTKIDSSLGDFNKIKFWTGNIGPFEFDYTWDEWCYGYTIIDASFTTFEFYTYGFTVAPTAGQFTLEIKDVYIYEITGVSNDTVNYIISQQNINYTDGTVTYGGNTIYAPDESLTLEGKAADAKAVGDRIEKAEESAESLFSSVVNVPFSFNNTWINSSGVGTADNNYFATDYIDIDGAEAISYAGRMGSSSAVFWYNSEKTFIQRDLVLGDTTAYYYNVLTLKPSNAKYLRLQSKKMTASNPPAVTPEAKVFYGKNYLQLLINNIVGDGVTDDTSALQKVVNMASSVVLTSSKTMLISSPIHVSLGYAKILDGSGASVIVNDDFYAFDITGTLRTSADAETMDEYVVDSEAGAIIKNWRILSSDGVSGGGFNITKAFSLTICNNYIHHCKNGIRMYGQCRDIIISNNHIFALIESGLLFDDGVNVHQCNITSNMIMFALTCINIYHPSAIANFQIVGNDIEIEDYPPEIYISSQCINMDFVSTTGMFGEIEICGNTIQGHETSNDLIYISGNADIPISELSIVGNHISNSRERGIYLENVINAAISGNTYKAIHQYIYSLEGNCENIVINGDVARGNNSSGGRIHAASTATLANIKCKNCICTPYGSDNIETTNITNVDLT